MGKGASEIHVIFDNPGRLSESPKQFERNRRDSAASVITGHCCDETNGNTAIPIPWGGKFYELPELQKKVSDFYLRAFSP